MKELSIEEKAKRYNDAIERAKAYQGLRSEMEIIFPELKESEVERTRKEILNYIIKGSESLYDVQQYGKERFEKWIAWLEKQCEQKQEWSEEDRMIIIELIGIFESAVDGGHVSFPYRLIKDYIRVLKSCLPQSTWKPSDEQIECLSDAIKHYNSLGYPASKLKELLEDLKKLREEKL